MRRIVRSAGLAFLSLAFTAGATTMRVSSHVERRLNADPFFTDRVQGGVLVGAALGTTGTPLAEDGAAMYRTYCASCHGVEGRGNGPVAASLRHQPPDITLLSQRNGAVFPEARIRRIVDGREVESHGTRDMPVWGDVFKTARADGSSGDPASRIAAIVSYLESIQQRNAQ